jgi:RHS repeat-associated protein
LREFSNGKVERYGYQGSEKDDELGSGFYYTQYRHLDSDIGRWGGVDPKPNSRISSFNAMGCNPIIHNDPLGDTIKLYGSNRLMAIYNGGRLYNQDGSEFTAMDDYIMEAANALNQISSSSTYGFGMIFMLEQSEYNIGIINAGVKIKGKIRNENAFHVDRKWDAYPKRFKPAAASRRKGTGKGSGGMIIWNPNLNDGGPDQFGSTIRPISVGLAHELAHAFDAISAQLNPDFQSRSSISKAEVFATHVENIIRADNGLPLRTFYCPSCNFTTQRLLDNNGDSRYYLDGNNQPYNYQQNSNQVIPFILRP